MQFLEGEPVLIAHAVAVRERVGFSEATIFGLNLF